MANLLHILVGELPAKVVAEVGGIARRVRDLLSQALDLVSPHLGDGLAPLGKLLSSFAPAQKFNKKILGPWLNKLFQAEEVRKGLAGLDLSGEESLKAIKRLDKKNMILVGWAGHAVPLVIVPLHMAGLVGIPAGPAAAVILLAWILLVSADQLDSPVRWHPGSWVASLMLAGR